MNTSNMNINTRRSFPVGGCLLCLIFLLTPALHADWLVTREGQRIQTEGPWKVKGRMVVFTSDRGTLSSIRLDEVDLEASEKATSPSAQSNPPGNGTGTAARRQRPSVMVLTNQDVARGEDGAVGAEGVAERLRLAQQLKDLTSALALVNWQDTPQGIRDVMETQFEWMMDRRIRDIRLSEVDVDTSLNKTVDGVVYEPNVDVTHEMVIEFIPDPDSKELTLSLYVGQILGSYFIAAARPAEGY